MPNGFWVRVRQLTLAPYTMEKIIFSHAAEETSIQSLVFSSYSLFLCNSNYFNPTLLYFLQL
jgi:hypothetical protein